MLLIMTSPGKNKGFLGVVTLEDVVEVSMTSLDGPSLTIRQELIGKEIIVSSNKPFDLTLRRTKQINTSIATGTCPSPSWKAIDPLMFSVEYQSSGRKHNQKGIRSFLLQLLIRSLTSLDRPNALRRIFEGRLARHKVVLEAANGDEEGNMLIDHPLNA